MNTAACLLLLVVTAPYVEPPPRIERPSVGVVQRGTDARLQIGGKHLRRAQRVVFDDPSGLSAVITSRTDNRLHLTLTVDSTAATGARELRIVNTGGTSNAVTIRIDVLPVALEVEPNNRRDQATHLGMPSIVCGSIHAGAESDRFLFRADKGTRVVFDVEARRIGSSLDPDLTVLDASGRGIAWSRPSPGGDAVLVFDPPDKGTFLLVLRDIRYRGGPGFDYQLRAGAARRVAAVFPLAGKHGQKAVLTASDCDPDETDHETFEVDLGGYDPGQETLVLSTPRGTIVTAGFSITRNDAILESEPNDDPAKCNAIRPPVAVSARIGHARDTDYYRLEVDKPQTLRIEARSRAFGSKLDPLLVLQDKAGKRLKIDDDSGDGSDARIDYEFEPGTYRIVVRSLVGRGGIDHTYLLTAAPPEKPRPDFEVRFRPDSPIVRRGSHAKLWCEVVRRGGFEGDVELSFADLPAGVRAAPVRLRRDNGWTTVFTVSATDDAHLGAVPLRLRATGSIAGAKVARHTTPEAGAGSSKLAWLTVLDRARFVVTPLGPPPAAVRARWQAERRALQQKLLEPDPAAEAELSRFEDAHREGAHWVAVRADQLRTKNGATLKLLPDGSVLAGGKAPDTETYTFEFESDLDKVAALRLDVLPHPSTPTGGLGRAAGNANFVLNRFEVTADGRPVQLVEPKARFAQKSYPLARVLDGKKDTGWASAPQTKQPNWAIFALAEPISGPARFAVTLDQQHGQKHTIGRFRVSVATTRRAAETPVVPQTIHEILMAARADRPEEDVVTLRAWFRKLSPTYEKIRRRIAEIDAGRGNQSEIARLERQLRVVTPEIAAAQKRWERETVKRLVPWTELSFSKLRSEQGVRFTREPDNVVRVRRAVADKDNYELVAKTDVRGVTAIRLETLPAKDLPKGGAGLAPSGNFVLSDISVRAWPASNPSAIAPVPLQSPSASFEQGGYPIRGTLDGSHPSGWGVFPRVAEIHYALWRTRQPIGHEGGTVLRLYLEHQSGNKRHQLGRFRISVTNAKNPTLAEQGLPLEITRALTTPQARRTAAQMRRLQVWYRGIAKELDGLRRKIQLLDAQQSAYPPKLTRGKNGRLAVRVLRRDGFDGEVKVSLEGFSSGREGNRTPRLFTRNFEAKPVALARGQSIAVLEFKARPKCELGTRSVVVRTEAKIGGQTVVEYSAPIPFTVGK